MSLLVWVCLGVVLYKSCTFITSCTSQFTTIRNDTAVTGLIDLEDEYFKIRVILDKRILKGLICWMRVPFLVADTHAPQRRPGTEPKRDPSSLGSKSATSLKLSKVTPYAFLQAWKSLKFSEDANSYATLLDQVHPPDLSKGRVLFDLTACDIL